MPAYSLPPPAQATSMLRFVLREGMSASLIDQLLIDIKQAIDNICGATVDEASMRQDGKEHHIC